MGLFDALSKVGAAVGEAVENATNEYKEKKAYEAAETEMKMSINEKLNEYAEGHLMALNEENAELVMSLEILIYDSFSKDGYADSYDLLFAFANDEDIEAWASNFSNCDMLIRATDVFYENYFNKALETEWYREIMSPFYGEEAPKQLAEALNSMIHFYIGDLAIETCKRKYGDENVVLSILEERGFDFWDPLVAFTLNSDEEDMTAILDKYEKRCFKKYKRISLYVLAKRAGLCDDEGTVDYFYLKENGVPCFVGIVNDALVYLPLEYPEIKTIAQLRYLSDRNLKRIMFKDILYWKQIGEKKTEVGIKKPSATVAIFASTKGVVAPQRLEEREIDTREIELVTKSCKLHFAYESLDIFEKLLPQFEYDTILINKLK